MSEEEDLKKLLSPFFKRLNDSHYGKKLDMFISFFKVLLESSYD